MSIYAHIKRCLELSDRDVASAIADRRLTKALLDQLAKVSKPGDGAPKLLLVFAKIAAAQVDWIDGALRVELVGDGGVTAVEVLCELGAGMHERVFPSFKMAVPLEEFARAVERVPHMIEPLSIAPSPAGRLVLTATEGEDEEEEEDIAVAAVSIADESMYASEKRTSPKEKTGTARASSPKVRPVSRPDIPAVVPPVVPKVIASRSGKTLRPVPAASAASAPRIAPMIVPRPPALPRTEQPSSEPPAAAPPEPKRAAIARVPLARIQVPRSAAMGSRPPPKVAASAPKRASKAPPAKRASLKPAPPAKAGRASKAPPPRAPSVRPAKSEAPPKAKRARALSEPPDEESIDTGWDDE